MNKHTSLIVLLVLLALALTACAVAAPVPPTATPAPPTATSAPPTATPLPPTATPMPPTATSVPPTATPTQVPPTATSIPPSPTPRIFTSADLPKLVLQPDEVPSPTQNDPRYNQQTDADAFLRSTPGQADQFRAWGLQAMYLQGTNNVSPCNMVCSIFSWALMFKDMDGAHKALGALEANEAGFYQNPKKIPATELGDEGYGMQGILATTGQEVIVYVWRVNNVILACHFNTKAGTSNPNDVLATASKMHAHTK